MQAETTASDASILPRLPISQRTVQAVSICRNVNHSDKRDSGLQEFSFPTLQVGLHIDDHDACTNRERSNLVYVAMLPENW